VRAPRISVSDTRYEIRWLINVALEQPWLPIVECNATCCATELLRLVRVKEVRVALHRERLYVDILAGERLVEVERSTLCVWFNAWSDER
jgi:hypothetical protein